jgi:patatin-related protein
MPLLYGREVRLGIVMYGGVSLAVYENGVAQELFRAVKGERVYGLIKALTNSDVVVDIMSGTSAGGINGIFLGYALANNLDFKYCANLWREDGDILKLLRQPDDKDTYSILDSQGYYQPALQDAFAKMDEYKSIDGSYVSEIEELDMFVTGTNAYGRVFTEYDSQGHAIDVKDHRQVFRLSYRQDRKNDFDRGGAARLAKLSRITSCFPVAFEPVAVCPTNDDDKPLLRWGNFAEPAYFLDGGLLDNKPFTLTLRPIFHRTEDREVERLLLYVEPDPELFDPKAPHPEPDVVHAAFDALISIPGYQSIASDLQAIAEHNDRVKRYKEIYDCVKETVPQAPADGPAELKIADFNSLDDDPQRKELYLRCRFTQIRERAVLGILKEKGHLKLLKDGPRRAAEILVCSFENWPGDGTDTLEYFDVYFRLRRLYRLTYTISALLYGEVDGKRKQLPNEQIDQYCDLWSRINHQIKLLEIIQEAMEELIDLAPIEWRDLENEQAQFAIAMEKWQAVKNLMCALLSLDGADLQNPEDLSIDRGLKGVEKDQNKRKKLDREQRLTFRCALGERVERLKELDGGQVPTFSGKLLFSETDRLEQEILKTFAPLKTLDPISQEYCQFLILDSYLFPAQYMARMESTDVIQTVRMSPRDAKFGYPHGELRGIQLGHFGGFLKSSWRANDIMCGRMDAASQLVQCLVTPGRIKNISQQAIAKVEQETNFAQLFGNSTAEQLQEIKAAILSLNGNASSPGSRQAFETFWGLLAKAEQREILNEEMKNVVGASIQQQREWNEYDVLKPSPAAPYSRERQGWTTGVQQLDSEVTRYAAQKISEEKPAPDGGWVKYYQGDYGVSSETWEDDIPKPILLEMITTIAMVLRNCLLGAAGPYADQIRHSPIYKFGVNWPLTFVFHLARWRRTAPEYTPFFAVVYAVIFAVCISVLIFDAIWRDRLFWVSNAIQWGAVLKWVGIPAAVMLAVAVFLSWYLSLQYRGSLKRSSVRKKVASSQTMGSGSRT